MQNPGPVTSHLFTCDLYDRKIFFFFFGETQKDIFLLLPYCKRQLLWRGRGVPEMTSIFMQRHLHGTVLERCPLGARWVSNLLTAGRWGGTTCKFEARNARHLKPLLSQESLREIERNCQFCCSRVERGLGHVRSPYGAAGERQEAFGSVGSASVPKETRPGKCRDDGRPSPQPPDAILGAAEQLRH
ncbi:UNVERIFIED_CONTAM: hypothetical protein K2H54_023817 [Gekko kuhli]